MDFLLKIEIIIVCIIIFLLVMVQIIWMETKNKQISKFFEKMRDFLSSVLKHV